MSRKTRRKRHGWTDREVSAYMHGVVDLAAAISAEHGDFAAFEAAWRLLGYETDGRGRIVPSEDDR